METITTKSGAETQALGEKFALRLNLMTRFNLGRATVVCLYGDLGSGKTTFVQGLAKGLGVSRRISSPTFIIVRQYVIPNLVRDLVATPDETEMLKQVEDPGRVQHDKKERSLYHIDLYRCETESDLKGIGIQEILGNPKNVVVIEWSEKLGSLLPEKRIDIKFQYVNEEERKISIEK